MDLELIIRRLKAAGLAIQEIETIVEDKEDVIDIGDSGQGPNDYMQIHSEILIIKSVLAQIEKEIQNATIRAQ